MSKTIIISPSGNFYGSEQVLWEYLHDTGNRYTLYLPANSLFLEKLIRGNTPHHLKTFDRGKLPFLYTRLLLILLFRQADTVYVNEAGHSRFLLLLAKFFPSRQFVAHIRMLEDAHESRWGKRMPANVRVVSISESVAQKLPFPSELIYDPYRFTPVRAAAQRKDAGRLIIGIIGRVTGTKGLGRLPELSAFLDAQAPGRFVFQLYGGASDAEGDKELIDKLKTLPNVELKGFQENKEEIYNNIDCVLHLSVEEALGRIFFEAIDYGKPFLGFKIAGIAEIGSLTGLEELLVEVDDSWKETLAARLRDVDAAYDRFAGKVAGARATAAKRFHPETYVVQIDKLINT